MKKIVTPQMLEELIDYIQGTCKSLFETCMELGFEEDDLTIGQLEELDNAYTCCPSCGWWVESSRMQTDEECDDCYEGEDE